MHVISLCTNIARISTISKMTLHVYTSQNLIRATQCKFPGHHKTFNSVVKPKPKCGSGIGFQFHTPGTKENILSQKIVLGKKIMFFYQKSQISGIFKKSVLDFKYTPVRL